MSAIVQSPSAKRGLDAKALQFGAWRQLMLNAIICVWQEEDIIFSTVKHALALQTVKPLMSSSIAKVQELAAALAHKALPAGEG